MKLTNISPGHLLLLVLGFGIFIAVAHCVDHAGLSFNAMGLKFKVPAWPSEDIMPNGG